MNCRRYSLAIFVLLSALVSSLLGQQTTTSSAAAVPQLVNFSGTAIDAKGNVVSGIMGITLSLYKEQYEGAPLWTETQNVTADVKGNYTVQLGASKSGELPLELFSTGEAHWLGVRINGDEEQPRVLLLSVPYALKAADAQTLGGFPASAFALASAANPSSANPAHTSVKMKSATIASVGGTGTADYIPLWTSSTALGNSALYQLGTKVGLNTKTPATALDVTGKVNVSGGFDLGGKNFAFGSYSKFNAFLGFAGNATMTGTGDTATGFEVLLNNTTGSNNTASGFEALLFNTTGSENAAFGDDALQGNGSGSFNTGMGGHALQFNSTGTDNTGTGYQALYANSVGTDNTANGYHALYFNKASQNTAVGSQALYNNTSGSYSTTLGYQALFSNTTGVNNTASGYQALYSTTTAAFNTATGYQALYSNAAASANTAIGYQALFSNISGVASTAIGTDALYYNTGSSNTATGFEALYGNTTGDHNTAMGSDALQDNTTGNENTAVGEGALHDNTTGSNLTCVGYECSVSSASLSNATALGAHAVIGQSNSLVLGGTGQWGVRVGIGTAEPSNILTVGRGLGHPVSDSWETYSSRRWKTNIQTLPDALSKVERLRGVSYNLKDSGKHEIGVIAEEVGQVVPEVVSYEANGRDARGVDYSRLTALLIEAVKEQHKEISALRAQLRKRDAEQVMLESRLGRLEQYHAHTLLASARPNR
jgi:trimeric autotransporter adhesin